MSFDHLRLIRRAPLTLGIATLAIVWFVAFVPPGNTMAAAPDSGIGQKIIAADELPNVSGNKLTAVVVQLAPGAKAPKHHHAGFVFAYVLSGTVRSQLNSGRVVTYTVGQNWVEPPGTEHTLIENPSTSAPASLLAVFVAPEGAQLTTYDK
jgi:quercetin dioxygenase-like cupin family protein